MLGQLVPLVCNFSNSKLTTMFFRVFSFFLAIKGPIYFLRLSLLLAQNTSLLIPLVTKCVEVFPTPSSSLPHKLGGLQCNLVLTPSTWRGYQSSQVKAQSDKTDPSTSFANPTFRLSPVLPTDWL